MREIMYQLTVYTQGGGVGWGWAVGVGEGEA